MTQTILSVAPLQNKCGAMNKCGNPTIVMKAMCRTLWAPSANSVLGGGGFQVIEHFACERDLTFRLIGHLAKCPITWTLTGIGPSPRIYFFKNTMSSWSSKVLRVVFCISLCKKWTYSPHNFSVEINSRSDSPNTTTDSTASSTKSETYIRLGKGIWLSKTYHDLRFTGIMCSICPTLAWKNAINILETIFEARK